MDKSEINYCDEFLRQTKSAIGNVLEQLNLSLERAESVDGCRLFFRSPIREICIYDSFRNGEVNCLVSDKHGERTNTNEWIPIRAAVGCGGISMSQEFDTNLDDDIRSNETMLDDIGRMLLQLAW